MTQKRIYLKEWRKHRGYTQKQVTGWLAELDDDRLPQTDASLSRIERGEQPYSQRILEALADKYLCEPWELIGRDPTKEGKVIDLVAIMNDRQRAQAVAILEALIRGDGTDGQ
jgi:transcriptional regulator with XRE-family HTH domain